MSLITNNDFSYWDLSKTNVFQNFSETYSSTLWLLQKKTNSLWLSWERNPKDTWSLVSCLLLACKKTFTSILKDCKILCHFRYYSRRLNTQKKDKSSALRNGKSSHWFAPGRKMHRYYHSLEVLCFARCHRCHFRAHYQRAPGYTKACEKDQVLLPCPVDRHFSCFFFFFFKHRLLFFCLLLRGHKKKSLSINGFQIYLDVICEVRDYFLIQMEARRRYKRLLKSSCFILTRHKNICSLLAKTQLINIIIR